MLPINREECLQRGLPYNSERVEGLLGDLKSLMLGEVYNISFPSVCNNTSWFLPKLQTLNAFHFLFLT